ncbi:MAG: hypothetical protein AUJ23_03280 [Candidatus Magasanikbacteria bacterium CG1_02_32_51]|uniref:PsbP C-terminal domain-containing protein n=1 Tax=Candidatus Magasanikbacteria bacterium CG1_02_32_51 TaxID=1805238 RepID=A0A1J4U5J8_9BACT|nr:MAG: hypothetical protein AUJ23_03280 [Candidatus Magasanikbacteria bacterium CG1_02_32_51]
MKYLRLGFLALAFFLVALLSGCTRVSTDKGSTDNTKSVTISDKKQEYSINAEIPKDWKENKKIDAQAITAFSSPTSKDDPSQVNIIFKRFDFASGEADMTIDQYVDNVTLGKEKAPGYRMLFRTPSIIAEFSAITLAHQETVDSATLQFRQTFIKTAKAWFEVTMTGNSDGITKYKQVYNDFIKSVVVK